GLVALPGGSDNSLWLLDLRRKICTPPSYNNFIRRTGDFLEYRHHVFSCCRLFVAHCYSHRQAGSPHGGTGQGTGGCGSQPGNCQGCREGRSESQTGKACQEVTPTNTTSK